MAQTARIKWIDVVRCFGIYLIYTAHYSHSAGFVYQFAFSHHVPLFFLISGCMENLSRDHGILDTARKTFRSILIPWLFYAVLSVVVDAQLQYRTTELVPSALSILRGTVRGEFLAGSVWFLTCIASVRTIFSLLKKLKNRWLILLACFGLFCVAEFAFPYRFVNEPRLPYNLDSGLYYIVFYGIGYALFPWLCRVLEPTDRRGVILLRLSGLVTGVYTALLFFGKNLLVFLPGWMSSPSVAELLCPLIVTYFYCIVAKQLENVKILNRIGQNTLHLCGNEYIMNWLGISALGTLGLTPNLTAPISVCVYTVLTILTAVYLLIPIEKKVLRKLTEIIMDPLAKNKFKT